MDREHLCTLPFIKRTYISCDLFNRLIVHSHYQATEQQVSIHHVSDPEPCFGNLQTDEQLAVTKLKPQAQTTD